MGTAVIPCGSSGYRTIWAVTRSLCTWRDGFPVCKSVAYAVSSTLPGLSTLLTSTSSLYFVGLSGSHGVEGSLHGPRGKCASQPALYSTGCQQGRAGAGALWEQAGNRPWASALPPLRRSQEGVWEKRLLPSLKTRVPSTRPAEGARATELHVYPPIIKQQKQAWWCTLVPTKLQSGSRRLGQSQPETVFKKQTTEQKYMSR